jgi:hypothetical protein
MRTKTLALTTVMGVASIAAAVAQTTPVYSVNAVGYINVDVPPKYSLIANQLNAADSTVATLFPSVPGGTTIFKFDNAKNSFSQNQYDSDFKEWSSPTQTLIPGEGAFILNPTTNKFTVTFVGEVPQGDVSINIPAGYSILSSKVPQAGDIQKDLGYTPAGGDTVYMFDSTKQSYQTFQYDSDFQEWTAPPVVKVGQAFFMLKKTAGKWTRTFSVN